MDSLNPSSSRCAARAEELRRPLRPTASGSSLHRTPRGEPACAEPRPLARDLGVPAECALCAGAPTGHSGAFSHRLVFVAVTSGLCRQGRRTGRPPNPLPPWGRMGGIGGLRASPHQRPLFCASLSKQKQERRQGLPLSACHPSVSLAVVWLSVLQEFWRDLGPPACFSLGRVWGPAGGRGRGCVCVRGGCVGVGDACVGVHVRVYVWGVHTPHKLETVARGTDKVDPGVSVRAGTAWREARGSEGGARGPRPPLSAVPEPLPLSCKWRGAAAHPSATPDASWGN